MSNELKKVFIVFSTHFDNGFTGTMEDVQSDLAWNLIPRALKSIEKSKDFGPNRRFTWTLPAWPLENALMRLEGTKLGRQLEKAVAEGYITWHALPFTTHTELFGLEDFIRTMLPGYRLSRRFGRRSIAAKLTDVPGHTRILPTLMAASGVSFLYIGCNACSTPPDVPILFDWEGPDHTRVTTMYSKGGYGSPILPPPGYEFPIWLALIHASDNGGPQPAEAITEAVAQIEAAYPGIDVVVGSLDDFAIALRDLKLELPVVRSDLADSWIHGIATMPEELGMIRQYRERLAAIESFEALKGLESKDRPPDGFSTMIHDAYEAISLFGEHTWGLDTKLALNPPAEGGRVYDKERFTELLEGGAWGRIRGSWREKAALTDRLVAAVNSLEESLEKSDSSSLGSEKSRCLYSVRNHQLWEHNGLVRLGQMSDSVQVLVEGQLCPTVRLDGELWADIGPIAPLGLRNIEIVEKAEKPRAASQLIARKEGRKDVLDNGLIRVVVDVESGNISSFFDLRSGREWVDAETREGFGSYRYDIFGRDEITAYLCDYAYDLEPWFIEDFGKPEYPKIVHHTYLSSLENISITNGVDWGALEVVWSQEPESMDIYGNARRIIQKLTLPREQPWLDITYHLEDKSATQFLESGHIVFPLAAQDPHYAINKTGWVLDPAHDIEKDANRILYACERWIDVEDSGEGLLFMPLDSPLFSIGSIGIERFDGRALPGPPILNFNLFNNQWGTNFPQWIEGSLTYRFRIAPHKGDWREAKAWRLAAEAFQPPACLPYHGASEISSLAAEVAGLGDLEVLVWKRPNEGEGWILRLRDPTGLGGNRKLRLSPPPRMVFACDLFENGGKPIAIKQDGGSAIVEFGIPAFGIMTLKLLY